MYALCLKQTDEKKGKTITKQMQLIWIVTTTKQWENHLILYKQVEINEQLLDVWQVDMAAIPAVNSLDKFGQIIRD